MGRIKDNGVSDDPRAVEADLPAQLIEEFCCRCLQVASLTALLQDGDSFGWQSRGDGSDLLSDDVPKTNETWTRMDRARLAAPATRNVSPVWQHGRSHRAQSLLST